MEEVDDGEGAGRVGSCQLRAKEEAWVPRTWLGVLLELETVPMVLDMDKALQVLHSVGMGMMVSYGMDGPDPEMWYDTSAGGWGEEHD